MKITVERHLKSNEMPSTTAYKWQNKQPQHQLLYCWAWSVTVMLTANKQTGNHLGM